MSLYIIVVVVVLLTGLIVGIIYKLYHKQVLGTQQEDTLVIDSASYNITDISLTVNMST